ADLLVADGMDFHAAHQQVGALMAAAERGPLPPAGLHGLTPAASIARRDCIGGTAVAQVRRQAARVAAAAQAILKG
ncbi:MAG: hypothetical protein ACRD1E_03665, partial [Terriglobales bacterium]